MEISEDLGLRTWKVIRLQMQCQDNTLDNKRNTSIKKQIFIYGMIHTCLREVLIVYFTGVLQVKKRITLYVFCIDNVSFTTSTTLFF